MKNTVVATITTGISPAGIAVTPDNCFAYVANNNEYRLPGEYTVSVLNLKSNTLETTIFDKSFNGPYRVAINSCGTRVYVTNSNSTTISVIDTATNRVIDVIDGFDGPSGIVIEPKEGVFAYVSNYGVETEASTVRIVNLRTNKIVGKPIQVGLAPIALEMSPDGEFLYSVNYVDGNPGTGTISVIRISTHSVIKTISGFFGPFAMAITPNGRCAYVTNFGSNDFVPIGRTVSVIDLHCNTVIKSIEVGLQPAGIAVTKDGRHVYVANYNALYSGKVLVPGQGTVNIIDTETNEVIPPIIATAETADFVVIPNDCYAYVANYVANVVSVIALRCC